MKLAEALSVIRSVSAEAKPFPVLLACGFTPLHLQNYLAAHLQKSSPDRKVEIVTGLYSDPAGTLERCSTSDMEAVALILEWPDLDPRLGYRSLGGWGEQKFNSALDVVAAALYRFETAIGAIPTSARMAVSLPTLPLPPAFHTSGWQASRTELALDELVTTFTRRIAEHANVAIVNRQRLDALSPAESRYDFRSDLHVGFPYSLRHASAVGEMLAALIQTPCSKKGLITDLDDTLWSGLLGEVGHEQVSWDLPSGGQLHGLYQQVLQALVEHGVLIGVASKNSPEEVERALARSDLAVARDKIFPIEVHWEPKSGSVARILKAWNVGADSVVFVDDSPMELAEVKAAHPEMECLLFPKTNYAAGFALFERLRDLFGKPRLSEEDAYRITSIRNTRDFAHVNGNGDLAERFLSAAEAMVTIEYYVECGPPASDTRVVELINKTNQFNLNGVRYTEAEWQRACQSPDTFVLTVSYQDKFGPLGKIAVLRGQRDGARLRIATWVMSCRAFSRRIEHLCLSQLFSRYAAEEIFFDFEPTPKNGPFQEFLTGLLGQPLEKRPRLFRKDFEAKCPKLYQKIVGKHG